MDLPTLSFPLWTIYTSHAVLSGGLLKSFVLSYFEGDSFIIFALFTWIFICSVICQNQDGRAMYIPFSFDQCCANYFHFSAVIKSCGLAYLTLSSLNNLNWSTQFSLVLAATFMALDGLGLITFSSFIL